MTTFGSGRVVDVNAFSLGKLVLLLLAAVVLLILLFNSVTTIQAGNIGVLTLFGKVTGEQLDSGTRGIEVEDVLLRDIQLPLSLKASIELKQQAEQESLAMNFKLQKEKQEAERKRIEAQGIRDFQATVSQGISTQLLEWKGIEATETIAKSANTKIVVIGNSKN